MIINLILFFLFAGWNINACVFQARYGLVRSFWLNFSLSLACGFALVYRLS